MNYFLAKTDPETYSIDDLEKEKRTVWDGIRSPQALMAVKEMRPGDEVLIYHSQGQSAVVGLARVASQPRQDQNDSRLWVVDFEFVCKVHKTITLQQIKASHLFDDWKLVKQSRLSTMSTPVAFMEWIKEQGCL